MSAVSFLRLRRRVQEKLDLPLGKEAKYSYSYDRSLLVGIPRKLAREQINLFGDMPFNGGDFWNCYELSWLNPKGKPEVRIVQFFVPFDSENIVESKSVKLYLNSYNGTKFTDENEVGALLKMDLERVTNSDIELSMKSLSVFSSDKLVMFDGVCLDELDLEVSEYNVNSKLLKLSDDSQVVQELLYSNLLKSNCLVTNQPDWASVQIKYRGRKINHKSLLQYIISFRNHSEFHEQCVEHMFNDIIKQCLPMELTIFAKYTRRGGVDINPYRTNTIFKATDINKYRDIRQ